MTVTLTQVMQQQEQLLVFGQQVSDFYLRGDLGMGLDPAGPVGFAWIRAYQSSNGLRQPLAAPLLLSVHGPGEASGQAAAPDERSWRVYRDASVVQVVPSRSTWGECLAGNVSGPG